MRHLLYRIFLWLMSLLGSPSERETFLSRSYSDAKAAFSVFDRQAQRAQSMIESGYAALLGSTSDRTVLNLITILAVALEASPATVALIRNRALELSIDFDGLYDKAKELIDARRPARTRS